MEGTDRQLRADARRNREKLLQAAAELFGRADGEVPLEAVADRAGVGIGTLYRNFPTREALVEATYRREVAQIAGAMDELLAANPPDVALELWAERYVDYVAAKRGMSEALRGMIESGNDIYGETRTELLEALSRLVAAGVATRTLRSDLSAEDLFRATGSVFMLPQQDGWREQAGRLLRLIVDGMRYRAG